MAASLATAAVAMVEATVVVLSRSAATAARLNSAGLTDTVCGPYYDLVTHIHELTLLSS